MDAIVLLRFTIVISQLYLMHFFFLFPLTVYRRTSRCGRQSHVPKFPDHQRQQNGKNEKKKQKQKQTIHLVLHISYD